MTAKVRLEADRAELARFVDATFRYADDGTDAVLRTFAEGSNEVLGSVRVPLNGAGLDPMAATEEYFEAEDALGRWLEECCVLGPNRTETSADLFAAWKVWAEANGEFASSQRRFSDLMLARGFDKWRDPETDRRGLRGVALRHRPPGTTEMEF